MEYQKEMEVGSLRMAPLNGTDMVRVHGCIAGSAQIGVLVEDMGMHSQVGRGKEGQRVSWI